MATVNGEPLEVVNVYAPTGKEANLFLASHQLNNNALIMGEFNNHHPIWYGNLAESRAAVIRNGKTKARTLLTHMERLGLTLHNIPGMCTHFPRNGTSSTIPELSFSRGYATSLVKAWSANPEGGLSDHASITTLLNICPPTFKPLQLFHKAHWDIIDRILLAIPVNNESWASAGSMILAAIAVDNALQKAIREGIPWS